MSESEPSCPSVPILKRLFALSGNQCAFPKCTDEMILGETVVGKVCHIKAAKPRGPRYDKNQSATARHGYDNLILMCGTHHTVIDDDEEAYTVERLLKMKKDHENSIKELDGKTAEFGAQILIQSINQTGGITANTVNQHHYHFHQPAAG